MIGSKIRPSLLQFSSSMIRSVCKIALLTLDKKGLKGYISSITDVKILYGKIIFGYRAHKPPCIKIPATNRARMDFTSVQVFKTRSLVICPASKNYK
jgi:hypothetical protein